MIWYPYEQMKTMKAPYKIEDANGVYLYTKDQKLIDSVSSWWCMIHGYKHPELTAAIQEQAGKFCHVMLGGLTHDPVQKLSAKLEEFLPGDLNYCFFSDSGSVGVEVALKMALQYNTNRLDDRRLVMQLDNAHHGSELKKRTMVLALEHAYHGDTFKAMEVGDDEDYHFAFDKKEGVVHIPTEIPALEEAFAKYHDRLNCFIVEPLLQGAGGMRMYDISFLKRARALCDEYDVRHRLWPHGPPVRGRSGPARHSGAGQGPHRRLYRPRRHCGQREGVPGLLQRQRPPRPDARPHLHGQRPGLRRRPEKH